MTDNATLRQMLSRSWRDDPATKLQFTTLRLLFSNTSGENRGGMRVEEIKTLLNSHLEDGTLTKGLASDAITELIKIQEEVNKALAPKGLEVPFSGKVPDGRYALKNDDDKLRFYTVSTIKDGDYKGYQTLKVHASNDRHLIKGDTRKHILARIAADPEAAGKRYADETNTCYRCGRELTDQESRTFGLGPVCRTRI